MAAKQQLRSDDVRAALAYAADLSSCDEAQQFVELVKALPNLLGAESVMVSVCENWAPVGLEVGDRRIYSTKLIEAISRNWHEHPVLIRDLARPIEGASRVSDFVRQRDWCRAGLFNDFYRPLGMTRELAGQLSWGPTGSSCCVVLHRAGSDFSERDHDLLELLIPHLRLARERVLHETARRRRLTLLERGVEGADRGALILDHRGRLDVVGALARDLLVRWFGSSHALPGVLAEWWTTAAGEPRPAAFECRRGERVLRAQLVPGEDEDLIVLSEHGPALPSAAALARVLPITPRETEVLELLASGGTNDSIAHALGISRHTVVRHVEHLYAKLGVHSRVAATRVALRVAAGGSL